MTNKTTHSVKASEIRRAWWIVDAEGMILGRLAADVAHVLRGKHKPTFAPHLDTGDHVVIINADKVRLSGNKMQAKFAYRHSGYPGGLTATPYGKLIKEKPAFAVEKAVKGMLPHNRLGRTMGKKLKVYAGTSHPHEAQNPQPLTVNGKKEVGS